MSESIKVALVTGASRGIGKAIALELGSMGFVLSARLPRRRALKRLPLTSKNRESLAVVSRLMSRMTSPLLHCSRV